MKQPNHALAALLDEAGWSEAGLARRVNELGRPDLELRYDYTAVYRWIRRGERPREPVRALDRALLH